MDEDARLNTIAAAEFAALMAPFACPPSVAVAVSGGADSMALALLLRRWGDPLAIVVDHGLRPESAAEAALTMRRLAAMGVPARLRRLAIAAGPNLGERARAARYAALLAVCRLDGRPDLLLGHHARDQAETVVLRARRGSGAAGLAGMAAIAWRDSARLLRPLLAIDPARLRATLVAAGIEWVEDPGNQDPNTARGALRQGRADWPADDAAADCPARAEADERLAWELGGRVALYPTGYAEFRPPLSPAAWSALLWTVSGRLHPPASGAVARLAAHGAGTLHGVVVRAGVVAREPAAMAAPVSAREGARWDGRFVLGAGVPDATLGPLGADAARARRHSRLPSVVLQTLPAIRLGGNLLMIPHLAYPDAETCRSVCVGFKPQRPLAGGPFTPSSLAAGRMRGMQRGQGIPMSLDDAGGVAGT